MRKSAFSVFSIVLLFAIYSCNNDNDDPMVDPVTIEDEDPIEDPTVTLANSRAANITLLTKDAEKVWKISSAELTNSNGTFDISTNFNVNDDEFIFKKSPLESGKSSTDFEGSLEWRKNSDIILSADSQEAALNELYVPSVKFNFDFDEESGSKITGNAGKFAFTINDNGTIAGDLELDNAILKISLTEKLASDYQSIPSTVLNFAPAFTFDSNSIENRSADMVGSRANNSIYISMSENDMRDEISNIRPERILKYDLNASILNEKLFFDINWYSKQLIVNNNKILVVGGNGINSYDLDIESDPTTSPSYDEALGIPSFGVTRHGTAIYNNSLYIVGGHIQDQSLSDRIYKFDIETQAMTEFAIMPEGRSGARAEIINDKLYIFGGTEKFYTPPAENDIYIYDLNTAALTIETMPTGVDTTFASRLGNLIYVAGIVKTYDADKQITNADPYMAAYDTTTGAYTELETNLMSPSLETIHSMAILENKIYIIYGELDANLAQGQLQTWQVLAADI